MLSSWFATSNKRCLGPKSLPSHPFCIPGYKGPLGKWLANRFRSQLYSYIWFYWILTVTLQGGFSITPCTYENPILQWRPLRLMEIIKVEQGLEIKSANSKSCALFRMPSTVIGPWVSWNTSCLSPHIKPKQTLKSSQDSVGMGKWMALALNKKKEKMRKGARTQTWSPAQIWERADLHGHIWETRGQGRRSIHSTCICTWSSCILREPVPWERAPRWKPLAQ